MTVDELEGLLSKARDAGSFERIEFRDRVASFGETAIDAMTDWLGDARLGAFAVRVLERIGRQSGTRDVVLEVLSAVDRSQVSAALAGDVDASLAALGRPKARVEARTGPPTSDRRPGVSGRGYWVMRTSPWERPYVWAEAQQGRLRQGWGWNEEMNLDTIAEIVRRGGELSDEQAMSWRSRRMRTSAPDGMHVGDIILAPNLPEWGQLSLFRLTGSYRYSVDRPRRFDERFGHILPVELLKSSVDRRSADVSDGIRAMLRPQTRLYNISAYGGDIEDLLGTRASPMVPDRAGTTWTDREYQSLFGRFPPHGERPTDDEMAALAREMGRSIDAVSWQWTDGQAYANGKSASTTSEGLKRWLDRSSIPKT